MRVSITPYLDLDTCEKTQQALLKYTPQSYHMVRISLFLQKFHFCFMCGAKQTRGFQGWLLDQTSF